MGSASLVAIGCAFMFAGYVLAAENPSPSPEIAAQVVQIDRYPGQEVSFQGGVTGRPGLTYWEPIGYRPLKLDLYLPSKGLPRPTNGFPLIVYIHPGAWMGGDPQRSGAFMDFPGVLASLSARGYVVASIEYRLSGEAAFPAPIQDVKAAVKWLRLHASEYGIDPARAMTWGASAGGHLAGLAAVSCGVSSLEPAQPITSGAPNTRPDPISSSNVSDCVQGAVAWYGAFDIATIAAQARQDGAMSRDVANAPEWRMLGCFADACKQGQIAAASPVTYVNPKSPPMLLVVGNQDTTVPYHQTLEMAEKLTASNVPHELIVFPSMNHSLIGITPEMTREANLKALEATFRFIDETMRVSR